MGTDLLYLTARSSICKLSGVNEGQLFDTDLTSDMLAFSASELPTLRRRRGLSASGLEKAYQVRDKLNDVSSPIRLTSFPLILSVMI